MTGRNDIWAADGLMAAIGWTRVECDTCGYGVFTRTETGELVCRMCGEKRTDHRDECGESKGPGFETFADDQES